MGARTTSIEVGRTIRASRKRANLPLARVARDCRLSPTQLDGIECGRRRPTLAVLHRISRALGVPLAELVLRTNGNPRRLDVVDIARAILQLPDALGSKVDAVEAAVILEALDACSENQSAAARLLGMERKAFVRKLSRAKGRVTSRPPPPLEAVAGGRRGR
jgi:transcriptional regulator with XRE-family HTH domain